MTLLHPFHNQSYNTAHGNILIAGKSVTIIPNRTWHRNQISNYTKLCGVKLMYNMKIIKISIWFYSFNILLTTTAVFNLVNIKRISTHIIGHYFIWWQHNMSYTNITMMPPNVRSILIVKQITSGCCTIDNVILNNIIY